MRLYLQELREQNNWTIKELERRSKVPYKTIWDIEQNEHLPTLETYVKLCLSFNIEPFNDLLKEK